MQALRCNLIPHCSNEHCREASRSVSVNGASKSGRLIIYPFIFIFAMRIYPLTRTHTGFLNKTRANHSPLQSHSRSFSSTSRSNGLYKDVVFTDWKPQYKPKAEPNPRAKEIAILGGGITGLTAAFHISKQLPSARVRIFEKAKTSGGWLGSDLITVDGGYILFENGPRTLRNNFWGAKYTKDLVSGPECLIHPEN